MSLKRMVSAVLPSFIVDEVRARRWREQQAVQDAAALRDEEEARAREAARRVHSWNQACDRARAGGGYDTNLLTQFRIARARGYRPDGSLLNASILGLVARLADKPNLAVTDFGGAVGEMGADFRLAWPQSVYTVVEHWRLVQCMQSEAMWPGVNFAVQIPPRCDIFYASGALQYIANPLEAWERGLKSARRAAIIRRTYFSDREKFDVQISQLFNNGNGPLPDGFANSTIAYPRRTLNEADIRAAAERYGFDCIASLEEPDEAGDDTYSRQLVFWRRRKPGVLARLAKRLRNRFDD
jgi:putative methyltransferase (TIGR04325 family)